MAATTKRTENWSAAEARELRSAWLEHKDVIEGRLSFSLTAREKEQSWIQILERVNAIGKCPRTLGQLRKKVSDMKSSVKKRERERRRLAGATGGGPAPTIEDWEEKMLGAMGEVAVGGFSGTDTFQATIGSTTVTSEDISMPENRLSTAIPNNDQASEYLATAITAPVAPVAQSSRQTEEIPQGSTTGNPQRPNKKARSKTDKDAEERTEVKDLLRSQNTLLEQILKSVNNTNEILGKLFSVTVLPPEE